VSLNIDCVQPFVDAGSTPRAEKLKQDQDTLIVRTIAPNLGPGDMRTGFRALQKQVERTSLHA
jgi:hypothetical protein